MTLISVKQLVTNFEGEATGHVYCTEQYYLLHLEIICIKNESVCTCCVHHC